MKRKVLHISLILFWLLILSTYPLYAERSNETNSYTLILSSLNDEYYSLAREIAEAENLLIYHTLDEIIDKHPTFLLWVVSPEFLSEREMIHFNKIGKELIISSGIITGNTIDTARNLWLGAKNRPGDLHVVINGRTIPATNVKKSVLQYVKDKKTSLPLTQKNILDNLKHADYFIYNGHSGPRNWVENINANDIPSLKSCIIFSYGCNNMKLWGVNTIALSCVDKGAKAYAGYLYSPHASTIIGKNEGLNCQYTWKEFPIGHIAQIHNQELLKWMAIVPYFFLIGDPRISFQNMPPYQLVEDKKEDKNKRVLKFTDAPIGFIPVRIPMGADYNFISIPSNTSSSYHDSFFNSRLQMINIHNDKFILFKNNVKDFTINLYTKAPVFWIIQDYILDSFDKYIESLQHPSLYPFLAIFIIIHLVILLKRKKVNQKYLLWSIIPGILWTLFIGIYTYIRWENITVTSKILTFSSSSVISYIGNFLFTTYGGLLFFTYDSRSKKILALLAAVIHEFLGAIIWIGLPILLNLQINMNVFKIHYIDVILIVKVICLIFIFYSLNKLLIKSSNKKVLN